MHRSYAAQSHTHAQYFSQLILCSFFCQPPHPWQFISMNIITLNIQTKFKAERTSVSVFSLINECQSDVKKKTSSLPKISPVHLALSARIIALKWNEYFVDATKALTAAGCSRAYWRLIYLNCEEALRAQNLINLNTFHKQLVHISIKIRAVHMRMYRITRSMTATVSQVTYSQSSTRYNWRLRHKPLIRRILCRWNESAFFFSLLFPQK